MEWPFPIATTVPSLLSSDTRICSGVEAYASTDRTFARHFERDEYLQDVFTDLSENKNNSALDDHSNHTWKSAKLSLLRGLITRADFAAEQKLFFLFKWEQAMEEEDRRRMWNDAAEVNKEVRRTLTVLRRFQQSFTPYLDTSVETLEALVQASLPGAAACSDAETDEETDPGSL